MEKRKQSYFRPDPRTWLLLCLLGIASILLVHSEIGGLCLFLGCLLIHLLSGNANKILPYMLYYIVFYGIGWAGVRLLDSSVAFSVSSMLSSIGIVGRKILIPLSFATALAREPTGSLMAALQAMRFPKAVGIAASVVLRFFPTISGEYRACLLYTSRTIKQQCFIYIMNCNHSNHLYTEMAHLFLFWHDFWLAKTNC